MGRTKLLTLVLIVATMAVGCSSGSSVGSGGVSRPEASAVSFAAEPQSPDESAIQDVFRRWFLAMKASDVKAASELMCASDFEFEPGSSTAEEQAKLVGVTLQVDMKLMNAYGRRVTVQSIDVYPIGPAGAPPEGYGATIKANVTNSDGASSFAGYRLHKDTGGWRVCLPK